MLKVRSFRQLVAGTFTFWTVTVLGLLIVGVSLSPTMAALSAVRQYQQARECSSGTAACYAFLAGTLESVWVNNSGQSGACRIQVSSVLGGRSEYMANRSDCKAFAAGQTVRIKVWQGQITAISSLSATFAVRTTDNPVWIYENDRVAVILGVLIAGSGLVLSVLLWWRYGWPGRRPGRAFGLRTEPPSG